MRIDYKKDVILPKDMDKECIELCELLNRLPNTETFESCMGHYKNVYSVWFKCMDIGVLSRLSRAVSRNYSMGKFEIVCDSTDTDPYGIFWLRGKEVIGKHLLDGAISELIGNIKYWFDDKFDIYFSKKKDDAEDFPKEVKEFDFLTESLKVPKEAIDKFLETDPMLNLFDRH